MAKKRKVEEVVQEKVEADPEENISGSDADEEPEEEEQEAELEVKVEKLDEEEDITKVLEPFNKEQLIDLLRIAASKNPNLLVEIHRVADSDPAHRKLFVHGLGWETTSEKLRQFYSQYGEIEDCNVVADKITGKSKGYGFLCFKHRRSAQKALIEPQKKIENRMTACQLASAGPVGTNYQPPLQQSANSSHGQSQETLPRKIYVGNVHTDISSDKLYAFFSKFGEIEEGPLGFDKQTGKPKGYALFIYKTVEGARKALEEPSKDFEGHLLYCQKATDNQKQKAAAAATAPGKTSSNAAGGSNGYVATGGGYNVPAGVGYSAPNGATISQGSTANPAFYGQGVMAGAQQFGGVAPIQAALAVLAAAGQNPAAFGVPPAAYASFNPAMNAGQPAAVQGYGMSNPGYQNPQVNPYQRGQGSAARPHSAMRPAGGYMGR